MADSLIQKIYDGEYDGALDTITQAVQARRNFIAQMVVSDLRPGDTVNFSDQIRPKYLIGLEVKVVKINRETIVVDCPDDPQYGRFRNSKRVRCPKQLIAGEA